MCRVLCSVWVRGEYMQFRLCLALRHSPSTTSWETASENPWSFFSFILISPVSFLWHLLRSRRPWLDDFSILVLLSSWSSSPSLYHWIFIGLWPTNWSLNMAWCPTLTVRVSVKPLSSSGSNRGGSKQWESFQSWSKGLQLVLVLYFLKCDQYSSVYCIVLNVCLNLWRWPSPLFSDHPLQNDISLNVLLHISLSPVYRLVHLYWSRNCHLG